MGSPSAKVSGAWSGGSRIAGVVPGLGASAGVLPILTVKGRRTIKLGRAKFDLQQED